MIAGLILLQAALSIAVAGPPTDPEYLPLRVAAAEGYFTEEKLTVTLETLRAEPLAAQALGRGRVALAATSLDRAQKTLVEDGLRDFRLSGGVARRDAHQHAESALTRQ